MWITRNFFVMLIARRALQLFILLEKSSPSWSTCYSSHYCNEETCTNVSGDHAAPKVGKPIMKNEGSCKSASQCPNYTYNNITNNTVTPFGECSGCKKASSCAKCEPNKEWQVKYNAKYDTNEQNDADHQYVIIKMTFILSILLSISTL
jgi:hypothetical protein